MLFEATCCGQQATCCAQLVACWPQHVARPRNLLPRNMLRWCKRGFTHATSVGVSKDSDAAYRVAMDIISTHHTVTTSPLRSASPSLSTVVVKVQQQPATQSVVLRKSAEKNSTDSIPILPDDERRCSE